MSMRLPTWAMWLSAARSVKSRNGSLLLILLLFLGVGVDELRWLAPVRPGDKLHLEGKVIELTPSKTKPQGVVRIKWTAFNQHGDPVYTFTPINVVPRRPA